MTELIVTGRVQGVFCRHFCSQNAKRLGIRGSASNLMDGSVRVIIETDDEDITRRYVSALRENPFGIRFWGSITGIKVTKDYKGPVTGDYLF